jgi:hypothetical protein
MNGTKIPVLVAAFTAFNLISAAPAHAQGHGDRGRNAFGVSRGPVRAMYGPRVFVGPRGAMPRPIVGGSPFDHPHYVLRPAVRIGYDNAVGFPMPFAGAYPYAYAPPPPYQPYHLALGPVRRYSILGRSPLATLGRISGRVTRGAARLAFRLLIP